MNNMRTELLTDLKLERAAELLRQGEVVAFPTETVYGLGGSVFNEEAIGKIFFAKGRPSDNPLIVHIADLQDLETIVSEVTEEAYRLMEAFFPGPLTLILPSHPKIPSAVRAGLPSVAVRMPKLSLARDLIRLAGTPLVGPSANRSGKPSATTAQHVLDDLNGAIAAVLDGGECSLGIESTVLSLSEGPVILRPGSITPQQIEEVLKRPVSLFSKQIVQGAPPSPGMKYRHYAPKGKVKLYFSEEELKVALSQPSSKKRRSFAPFGPQALYGILREADAKNCEEILIYCDESMRNDLALMNRLLRASE